LGTGIPKNTTLAIQWLQKAAAQGNNDAKNRLAGIYARGVK
jgi:TPR repeat protein